MNSRCIRSASKWDKCAVVPPIEIILFKRSVSGTASSGAASLIEKIVIKAP
jgi:hypothetical protein